MAIPVDDNLYWLTDYRGYTLIRYDNDNFRMERFIPSSFFGLECNENNNNVYVNNNTTYFCLNNGIGRLDMNLKKTLCCKGILYSLEKLLLCRRIINCI